ncbi:EcsC family protein [Enterococcus faecium]|uniref:EcsC family protein n=1 Tax=Enterococcus faecium TaxID=1352 RepID=UPI000CF26DC1|nr:EcsC family protein [Enterococcus faecium]EGP4916283.1 EcsC family protein [Enterococcus faecium]EGP4956276.1 EcsC family protein [Enterococcus faecium]EGP5265959.1 bacteriochlorophyll 4-vinyl reductase [Enterococcus faecium]EGP5363867.1 bacteriochlorophyll 4-vinyl reductase [Enterococcus faecium]EGP5499625.1 bacteriochlorophyll 4-vinyl reductase [Enterococcus faecium]
MENNESLALRVVNESLKLPVVKVNRSEFLVKVFGGKVEDINQLIEEGPQAFLSIEDLDRAANNRIYSIVAQSSTLSFATGLPGGLAMAATIPADITQFYGYSLKLAQEISYIYGYEDIWNQQGELTEEAKETLILYLGIMLGVSTASSAVRVLSGKLSVQALKKIPQKALTKTIYYPVIKKVLAVFGTKLTKATFAKGVSKVVPVVGGVVSGGLNYFSMKPMATKLKNELRKGINYSEENLKQDLKILNVEDIIIDESNLLESSMKGENIIEQIEKAHDLLKQKIITEEEFISIKQNILSK